MTKEAVPENHIISTMELNILLLSFSKHLLVSIAEKAIEVPRCPLTLSGPCNLLLSGVWQCPPWPFLAFLPAVNCVWHSWVEDIVNPDLLHLTRLITQRLCCAGASHPRQLMFYE